jgi:hypothetical protein
MLRELTKISAKLAQLPKLAVDKRTIADLKALLASKDVQLAEKAKQVSAYVEIVSELEQQIQRRPVNTEGLAQPDTTLVSTTLLGSSSTFITPAKSKMFVAEGNPQPDQTFRLADLDPVAQWWQEEAKHWHFFVIASETGERAGTYEAIFSSATLVREALAQAYSTSNEECARNVCSIVRGLTRSDLESRLKEIHLSEEDRLILFFIGPGTITQDVGDRKALHLLLPGENSSVTIPEIISLAKGGVSWKPYSLLLILDVCNTLAPASDPKFIELEREERATLLSNAGPLQGSASAESVKACPDVPPSAFSSHLAAALSTDHRTAFSPEGRTPDKYDGILTLDRLKKYLETQLERDLNQQKIGSYRTPTIFPPAALPKLPSLDDSPLILYRPDGENSDAKTLFEQSSLPFQAKVYGPCPLQSEVKLKFEFILNSNDPVAAPDGPVQLTCNGPFNSLIQVGRPKSLRAGQVKEINMTIDSGLGPPERVVLSNQRQQNDTETSSCRGALYRPNAGGESHKVNLDISFCL